MRARSTTDRRPCDRRPPSDRPPPPRPAGRVRLTATSPADRRLSDCRPALRPTATSPTADHLPDRRARSG
ncbi:hypothetical protein STRIP9103_08732 [Streptomyces ipomoeae 91-03]|uniref:Uncharacterized protein n=1 Tax=Streptomyces ipomoeae 91-03 TaxID=698759 RepID=L1L645_9ACTN|nr:hypothetical protein STRIP9103_08732 [Streptomyces ipomoeae 91-03]